MVLNDAGNVDLLQINNASNSTVIGLPFSHVNIPIRNNVIDHHEQPAASAPGAT